MSDSDRRPEDPEEASDMARGWAASGSFVGSILAGTLLGYLVDLWLGTRPWFIVIGIVAGSYSGFVTMWRMSKGMENVVRRRP